jgi:uracil-DNA glycosylase
MVDKPAACIGCPLYGDGRGFVPDELVPGAEVLVLGQHPDGDDERGERVVSYLGGRPVYESCAPAPFIGKPGYELDQTYLPIAGLKRGVNVSFANVIKCRWIKNGRRTRDLPPDHTASVAAAHCTGAHLHIPPTVRLVVAVGDLAWEAVGGAGTVAEWRGFLK